MDDDADGGDGGGDGSEGSESGSSGASSAGEGPEPEDYEAAVRAAERRRGRWLRRSVAGRVALHLEEAAAAAWGLMVAYQRRLRRRRQRGARREALRLGGEHMLPAVLAEARADRAWEREAARRAEREAAVAAWREENRTAPRPGRAARHAALGAVFAASEAARVEALEREAVEQVRQDPGGFMEEWHVLVPEAGGGGGQTRMRLVTLNGEAEGEPSEWRFGAVPLAGRRRGGWSL